MQYNLTNLGSPCRNFMITNLTGFTDPKDGRAKVALVSFANFVSGSLYLVDPAANTAEQYVLQCDNGSYALYNDGNKGLVIGTCTQYGCIQYFDLTTRAFRGEPAAINGKGEYYTYGFAAPGDGYLYTGTYSGCQLLRYNIAEHKLEDLGRAHPNKRNLYSSVLGTKDGYVFIYCYRDEFCVRAYSLADGTFANAADLGYDEEELRTANELKDPRYLACKETTEGISRGCILPDGSLILISGQDYLYFAGDSEEYIRRPIPGTPPATAILTVGASADGKIWGASNFGMTVCSYDPDLFTKDERGVMHYADPSRPSYFGVDVSSWQGDVNWKKLKEEGVYFAFIRAGYRGYESGALNTDQNFEKNVQGALDAGIKVGVYFFSQALNAQEAYEEASYVLDLIDGYDITFPVVFDWETVSSDTARTNEIETENLCQAANVFCSTVEEAGYIPMVYCNQSVSLLYYELSRIDAYDFWYAEYKDKPTFYYDFDIWQYGCTGKFAGVPDADLDVNISFVDYSALKN